MSLNFGVFSNCGRVRRSWLDRALTRGDFMIWALVALLLPGCGLCLCGSGITGSGRTVTKVFELADFSKVAAGSAFDVMITEGDKFGVAVTVDDNLAEYLEVRQTKGTLQIGLKPNVNIRKATLKAEVTMPSLTGLKLEGATRTKITGFISDQVLDVELGGASNLRGEIKSGNARFRASGASRVELDGSAREARIEASGASTVNLTRFSSEDTWVDASGASHVTVNAKEKLEVKASGASSVQYVGQPASVKTHTSGASSVGPK